MSPGLYRPEFEHDNCGIGAVINIKGIKTHQTVENALSIVENLEHRAGKDAEGKTGDFPRFGVKDCAVILPVMAAPYDLYGAFSRTVNPSRVNIHS